MKFKTIIPAKTETGVENCKSIIYRFIFASISYNFWNPFVPFPEFIPTERARVSFVYLITFANVIIQLIR